MVFVKIREGEGIEEALRRFKRDCQRDGILKDLRRHEFYVTPSVRKKLKRKEAQRKARRRRNRSGSRPGGFSKFSGGAAKPAS
jgi:small subunit ribosomal protein S21